MNEERSEPGFAAPEGIRSARGSVRTTRIGRLAKLLAVLGPGWLVMMADVDPPSILTAAQSGLSYGGHLIVALLLLTLPLFLIQDTASRVAAVKGESLGRLVTEHSGHGWTIDLATSIGVIDFAAYVAEFAGIAVAGVLLGIPPVASILTVLLFHSVLVFSGSYRRAEAILLALSFLLLVFPVMALTVPPPSLSLVDLVPFNNSPGFFYLIAANIGAVIMPWMLYYHMSANVEKGIRTKDLRAETRETFVGALVSEILMISVVVLAWTTPTGMVDGSVGSASVIAFLADRAGLAGRFVIAVGLAAAGFLALTVISVSLSYAVADALRTEGGFNRRFRLKDPFYAFYLLEVIPGALVVLFLPDLIGLALGVMVFNVFAVAIPLVFIILLASNRGIMGSHAISWKRKVALWSSTTLILAFGVVSLAAGLVGS